MTESLNNMLRAAKSEDEAYDIICAHGNELSMVDQLEIFHMVYGKSELTEDELDMVVGGSWFSKAWNSASKWCSEHKREIVMAACAIAGAAIGVAGVGIMLATGIAGAATLTGALVTGATAGAVTGAIVGGIVAAVTIPCTNKSSSSDED